MFLKNYPPPIPYDDSYVIAAIATWIVVQAIQYFKGNMIKALPYSFGLIKDAVSLYR